MAYAAEGIGRHLGASHRDFAMRCAGALAKGAGLLDGLLASQARRPDEERRRSEDLMREVTQQVRAIILGEGDVSLEDALARLNLDEWPAKEALKPVLRILRHCPDEKAAVEVHRMVAEAVVNWWDADRDAHGRRGRRRDFDCEYEWSENVASFSLLLPTPDALSVIEAFVGAVDRHPREVAQFVKDVVIAEDQSAGVTPFWAMWQAIADRIKGSPWIGRVDSRHSHGVELLQAIFLGVSWKKGVRHWRRLEGASDPIDRLFMDLPPSAAVLNAYCEFLDTIGGQSLPNAFILIAEKMKAGNAKDMLSISNAVFCLESLLRQSVYSRPLELKSNARMRSAILEILDELVESGSSAAYRMRDDFVTPASG